MLRTGPDLPLELGSCGGKGSAVGGLDDTTSTHARIVEVQTPHFKKKDMIVIDIYKFYMKPDYVHFMKFPISNGKIIFFEDAISRVLCAQ